MTCYVSRITTDGRGADGHAINRATADALQRFDDDIEIRTSYAYDFAGQRVEYSRSTAPAIIVEVQR